MGLDKHEVFTAEMTVPATPELVRIQLGFTPKWIKVIDQSNQNMAEWYDGVAVSVETTGATGVRADAGNAADLRAYAGGQVIEYNVDTTPTYKYKSVNGTDGDASATDAVGDAVDADTYFDIEGNKVLAWAMPAVSTLGNGAGKFYVTQPGIQIDTGCLCLAAAAVITIQAGR